MHSEINATLAFHLTGIKSAEEIEPVESLGLRPALLAGYRDLAALRYDFPLVLLDQPLDGEFAQPLSALVDAALGGVTDQRVRAQALRREREIRAHVAIEAGSLARLWNVAPALPVEGQLVDCDALLPARFVTAAWTAVQAAKARRFQEEAGRLILQLENILAADFVRSDEGRSAEQLAAALASTDDSFDTKALSRLLSRALPEKRLPKSRQRRIRSLLSTLKSQRFFAGGHAASRPLGFVFYSCGSALQALRERRTAAIELARAMAAARLEAGGEYIEAVHDPLLHGLADSTVDAELLPDYLLCLNAHSLKLPAEVSGLSELLASGLPVKILLQHDDILQRSPVGIGTGGGSLLDAHARVVAGMALALNDVYFLQSSASNLYALRSRVLKGLEYPGTALFSVFSGVSGRIEGLPPYLVAAAAMESRAFPAFSYDPSARGERWERYSLENNPQPECDWVRHRLDFEDTGHQRAAEEVPFTLVDFASLDARYAGYFAAVPRDKVKGDVPTLRMVDAQNRLQTVIVAEPLVRAGERCLDSWRGLQALAKRPAPAAAPAVAPSAPAPAAAAEPAKAPAGDAPYIETPRCTTCEECVKINNRMFVYDANKQAYIADPKAGSYRELVEAAENCQVSIIHPGKPLDLNEPELAELLERAKAFL